jgi:hypothetical protein
MLDLRIRMAGCVFAGLPQGTCADGDWSTCAGKGTYRSNGTG